MKVVAEALVSGDRVALRGMEEHEIRQLRLQLEDMDMVLTRRGRVGTVNLCDECEGESVDDRGRECSECDGSGRIIDFGGEQEPYHG